MCTLFCSAANVTFSTRVTVESIQIFSNADRTQYFIVQIICASYLYHLCTSIISISFDLLDRTRPQYVIVQYHRCILCLSYVYVLKIMYGYVT